MVKILSHQTNIWKVAKLRILEVRQITMNMLQIKFLRPPGAEIWGEVDKDPSEFDFEWKNMDLQTNAAVTIQFLTNLVSFSFWRNTTNMYFRQEMK